MKKKLNIISLFGGMDTGRIALEELGYKINKNYYSEIKKHAIELTLYHNPNTILVGDINNWKEWDIDYSKIDFIFSGSPCQDLSIAGKRAGINGSRSSLFYTFVEILEHTKKNNPNVLFLQENVGSASKLDIGIMSRALGIYPCRINSKLVTAQLRDRYYWTNIRTKPFGMFGDLISDIPQPRDREIMFMDVIENGVVKKNKAGAILENQCLLYPKKSKVRSQRYLIKRGVKQHFINLVYVEKDKAVALLESESRPAKKQDSLLKRYKQTGMQNLVFIEKNEVRIKTNTKKGYDILTENDCLNLSFPKSKTRRGRITKGKSPCLLGQYEPLFALENYNVRVLTQTELERLQGFPDGFTKILSRNQAASVLGDGWTLPVIVHILSFIK